MAQVTPNTQSQAVVYLQKDGPFTAASAFQRGSAGLDAITLPGPGPRTVFYNNSAFGNPVPGGVTRASPAVPSTTIQSWIAGFRDHLQRMRIQGQCRNIQLRIHDCLSLDHPAGWTFVIHLGDGQTGDATIDASATREFTDERIGQSHPFNPIYDVVIVEQSLTRLTTAETESVNSIVFQSALENCQDCGNGYPGPDKIGYIGFDAAGAAIANMQYTQNGGGTWTNTTADPFAADEHIGPMVLRFLNKTQQRLVIARQSSDAGNPAEIAYADPTIGVDDITALTLVNVGSTNAETVTALAWPEFGVLLAGLSGGDIFRSTDQAETWTSVYTGSTQINAIKADPKGNIYAVGATNTILISKDDGASFSSLVGPTGTDASTSITIANDRSLWLGNGTSVFYTTVAEPTSAAQWTNQKNFGANHAAIQLSVKGGERALGGDSQLLHVGVNDGTATEGDIWLTIDGTLFQEITNLTNVGYNDVYFSPADDNLAFIAGELSTTGLIHKLAPTLGV